MSYLLVNKENKDSKQYCLEERKVHIKIDVSIACSAGCKTKKEENKVTCYLALISFNSRQSKMLCHYGYDTCNIQYVRWVEHYHILLFLSPPAPFLLQFGKEDYGNARFLKERVTVMTFMIIIITFMLLTFTYLFKVSLSFNSIGVNVPVTKTSWGMSDGLSFSCSKWLY